MQDSKRNTSVLQMCGMSAGDWFNDGKKVGKRPSTASPFDKVLFRFVPWKEIAPQDDQIGGSRGGVCKSLLDACD